MGLRLKVLYCKGIVCFYCINTWYYSIQYTSSHTVCTYTVIRNCVRSNICYIYWSCTSQAMLHLTFACIAQINTSWLQTIATHPSLCRSLFLVPLVGRPLIAGLHVPDTPSDIKSVCVCVRAHRYANTHLFLATDIASQSTWHQHYSQVCQCVCVCVCMVKSLLISACKNHFLAAALFLYQRPTTRLAFLTSTPPQFASTTKVNVAGTVHRRCANVRVQLKGNGIYFGNWMWGKESGCSWVNRRWPPVSGRTRCDSFVARRRLETYVWLADDLCLLGLFPCALPGVFAAVSGISPSSLPFIVRKVETCGI